MAATSEDVERAIKACAKWKKLTAVLTLMIRKINELARAKVHETDPARYMQFATELADAWYVAYGVLGELASVARPFELPPGPFINQSCWALATSRGYRFGPSAGSSDQERFRYKGELPDVAFGEALDQLDKAVKLRDRQLEAEEGGGEQVKGGGGVTVAPVSAQAQVAGAGAEETPNGGDERMSKEEKALGVLVKHPDWTNIEIARVVGCNPKGMSRMERFTKARAALQAGRADMPKGSKPKGENLDAHE